MGKITVKHYLNKRLKPIDFENGELFYPVYVRILWGREVIRLKSVIANQTGKFTDYLKEEQFNNSTNSSLFKIETKIIEYIFSNHENHVKKKENSLSDIIEQFTLKILDILSTTIYCEFDNISTVFKSDSFEDNFSFSVKKHLAKSINNLNLNFIEKSINIDFEKFNLIEDFKFIKNDISLKNICEIIKEIRLFEDKFYSKEIPLNAYEWLINDGYENFLKFVNPQVKKTEIFPKLMTELNNYSIIKTEV